MNLSKHDPKTEMEMDMTPMIDVVFLLIIFFMIITDLTQQEFEVLELPIAVQAVKDEPDPSVVRPIINIAWNGEIIVRKVPYYDPEENDYRKLEGFLSNQASLMPKKLDEKLGVRLPDNPLLIRADQVTPFKQLQKIMEICGKDGIQIWKLEIAAAQPEEK
ncbi:MAG: biopolymer transport protein ExbD [Planctomycetota bacterium]|jgi:biopolymer transport protein ExbD